MSLDLRHYLRLRVLFPALTLTVLLLGTLLTEFAVYAVVMAQEKQNADASLHQELARLQNETAENLLSNQLGKVQRKVSFLSSDPHVSSLCVLDDAGTVLAASRLGEIGASSNARCTSFPIGELQAARSTGQITSHWDADRHVLRGFVPVRLQEPTTLRSQRYGLIALEWDLALAMTQVKNRLMALGALLFAVYLIVFAFLLLFWQRRIATPLLVLEQTTVAVAADQHSARAQLSHDDEFGALAKSFNEMLDKLEAHASQLNTLFNASPYGIVMFDETKRLLSINPRCCSLFAQTKPQLLERPFDKLLSEGDSYQFTQLLNALLQNDGQQLSTYAHEVICCRRDNESFPAEIIFDEILLEGQRRFVAFIRDISERKKREKDIRRLAYSDELTGLPNRRHLQDRIEFAVAQADRAGEHVGLLYMDLDDFKGINDSFGHRFGDQFLIAISSRLIKVLRRSDTVARLGGDEFVILLPLLGTDKNAAVREAQAVAEKAQHALVAPFNLESKQVKTAASIGISIFPLDAASGDEMLEHGDTAMYQAKKLGRGRFGFFEQRMNLEAMERLTLEQDLHVAIEQGQFQLYYQPVVRASNEDLASLEALIRWQRPNGEFISPERFIPVAESNGLIVPIGEWVIREACKQIKQWETHTTLANIPIAVNVSAVQIQRTDLVETISRATSEQGIAASCLRLELTETSLIDHLDGSAEILNRLHDVGAALYIDDFGTGYSSLAYLKSLPFDALKIDQSFVRGVVVDDNDAAIVEAIAAMAKKLGLLVVAEGVEDDNQRDFLRALDIDFIQGYRYARPMPAADLIAHPIVNKTHKHPVLVS